MKRNLSRQLLHPLCLVGLLVFVIGLGASVVGLLGDLFGHESRPYQGLLTFVLYPSVMFGGLFLIILGLIIERRRTRKIELAGADWRPAMDLSRPRDRRILLAGVVLAGGFMLASIIGAFRAYEYTESVEFCGKVCHTTMNPQYTAYQDSPHAQVLCVECHVGPGVRGFVEAKVSGLRQVYEILTGTYPRPIFVHGSKLPQSEETCVHCHWSEKRLGPRLVERLRFSYDVQNTQRLLRVVLRGDEESEAGQSGIHWHANERNKVWYRARDPLAQQVPWTRVERPDGTSVTYRDTSGGAGAAELDALPEQHMECLDCHNRPAHRFLLPDVAIDAALATGEIPATLPFIKKIGVDALSATTYATPDEGAAGVANHVRSYYATQLAGVAAQRESAIDAAASALEKIYRRNYFPEMKIDGATHPSNLGHYSAPGCLRCHDGKHVSDDGKVLSGECVLCHEFFVAESRAAKTFTQIPADATTLRPFRHPEHSSVACWTCHSGAVSPYKACAQCHAAAVGSHGMRFECSLCHKPGSTAKVASGDCATCHPTSASPLHAHASHADCLSCHKQHTWKVDLTTSCRACHERAGKDAWESHYPGKACTPECHDFRGVQATLLGLPVSRGSVSR
jgi:hypothetical protein